MKVESRSVTQFCKRECDAEGWNVIGLGLELAGAAFEDGLVAAYALGSLAHDGFAPAVSDVDLALILDRLDDGVEPRMVQIRADVRTRLGTPLSGRLSLFWSTWNALAERSTAGRFPLADRQDLVLHGACLRGDDNRVRVALPEPNEMSRALVVESAEFVLAKLAAPERDQLLCDPKHLIELGCREVTKAVLFPVRFLYTAETGSVANNPTAIAWFLRRFDGPLAALVSAASTWREHGVLGSADATLHQLESGLLRLYALLATRYSEALLHFGEPKLAQGITSWHDRILAHNTQEP